MANLGWALIILGVAGTFLTVALERRWAPLRRSEKKDGTIRVRTPDARRTHPDTGGPRVGWMRFYEAVTLATEYAWPLKEMTAEDAATLLAEEFIERHPEHFDERQRYVERVPLTKWLMKHRVPMPYRWRWRRKSFGFDQDKDGRVYIVPSEGRRPLRDDE